MNVLGIENVRMNALGKEAVRMNVLGKEAVRLNVLGKEAVRMNVLGSLVGMYDRSLVGMMLDSLAMTKTQNALCIVLRLRLCRRGNLTTEKTGISLDRFSRRGRSQLVP